MEAFDFDNVKAEKANAVQRYNRLLYFTKFFRIIELCLILFFLSWSSTRLPFAVKLSGEYFRVLINIILTPLFIFLLTNAIVVVLLAKSGHFSGESHITNHNADTIIDFYNEFAKTSEDGVLHGREESSPVTEPEEIVYQDKEIICEVNTVKVSNPDAAAVVEAKGYRRCQSEKIKKESLEENCAKLRRSETEICKRDKNSGQVPVEKLSNEEFQKAIEEFIAKQVKFHQEEKFALVLRTEI